MLCIAGKACFARKVEHNFITGTIKALGASRLVSKEQQCVNDAPTIGSAKMDVRLLTFVDSRRIYFVLWRTFTRVCV